jgi:hypothetical protein
MKILIIGLMMLAAFALVWFTAAKLLKRNKVEDWITGVYIRLVSNDFSQGADTLTITKKASSQFLIKRRSSYRRLLDGQVFDPEYKTEDWLGVYDEKTQLLHEQQHGKVLSFQPGESTMKVGTAEYKKIQ